MTNTQIIVTLQNTIEIIHKYEELKKIFIEVEKEEYAANMESRDVNYETAFLTIKKIIIGNDK